MAYDTPRGREAAIRVSPLHVEVILADDISMVLLDPDRYLPAPDSVEGAAELAEELVRAAEQAAQWLADSLAVQVKPRKGARE